jgi:hypothetical protein
MSEQGKEAPRSSDILDEAADRLAELFLAQLEEEKRKTTPIR